MAFLLINGIPPNSYRLVVSVAGFQANSTTVILRTGVPMEVSIRLELANQQSSVVVEAVADNLVEKQSDNPAIPSIGSYSRRSCR